MSTFKEILHEFEGTFINSVTNLIPTIVPEDQKVEIPSNEMSSFSNVFDKIYACNHDGEGFVIGTMKGKSYLIGTSTLTSMDFAIIGDNLHDGARSFLTDEEIDEISNMVNYGTGEK